MPHLIAAFLGVIIAFAVGATTDEIVRAVFDDVNSAFRVNVVAGSSSASDITSGTTTITGGSDQSVCFDDTGVINCSDTGFVFNKTADNVTTRAYAILVPNAAVTGTTTSKLAKVNSSGQAVIVSTSDTDDAIGICVSGCGTTGNATIALLGNVSCIFDSATTAGNYVGIDTSTAGDCTDLGATIPSTGVSVMGRVLSTNGAGGTFAVNLNTPDVASVGAAGGGGKNPAGATGDVQYKGTGNTFDAEAAFNYADATNRLTLSGGTTANDNATNMIRQSGTMPTVPTGDVYGVYHAITGAGSAGVSPIAMWVDFLAGYTGSAATQSLQTVNANAGTGATLSLNATTIVSGNGAIGGRVTGSTTGYNVAVTGDATNSTRANMGVYGKANAAVGGSNIGGLFNASASTEATDIKNAALVATLNSTLPTLNGSFAVLIDGGTLPDATSAAIWSIGTLPSAPASAAQGAAFQYTSAGNASQTQFASVHNLLAGYTGSSMTRAISANNLAAGTGNALNLGTANAATGNIGGSLAATGSTSGLNVGSQGYAASSSGANVGSLGFGVTTAAGTNIGVLGNANGSTEATDLKNVSGYFTLATSLITGSNISVALLADNGAVAAPIFNAYDNGTLVFSVTDGGGITTTGGATGISDSGTCTITAITNGIITGGNCV